MDKMWIGLIIGLAILLWWVVGRFNERDFAREKSYSINAPFPLSGIPDLVRQEMGGELTIHDLKTRSRAVWFESDKIQLSLYRLLISRATGRKVRSEGYIRVRMSGKPDQILSVPLYKEVELIALYDRYIALLAGREEARFAKFPSLCARCGFHQQECFPNQNKELAKASSLKRQSTVSGPSSKRAR